MIDGLVIKYQGAYTHDEILLFEYGLVMDWLYLHKEQQEYRDRYYEAQKVINQKNPKK
jgi:hypothetical protein